MFYKTIFPRKLFVGNVKVSKMYIVLSGVKINMGGDREFVLRKTSNKHLF